MAFLSQKRASSVNFVKILNTPKKLQKKKIDFHKTPRGGGVHRFMKFFHKIDFF